MPQLPRLKMSIHKNIKNFRLIKCLSNVAFKFILRSMALNRRSIRTKNNKKYIQRCVVISCRRLKNGTKGSLIKPKGRKGHVHFHPCSDEGTRDHFSSSSQPTPSSNITLYVCIHTYSRMCHYFCFCVCII